MLGLLAFRWRLRSDEVDFDEVDPKRADLSVMLTVPRSGKASSFPIDAQVWMVPAPPGSTNWSAAWQLSAPRTFVNSVGAESGRAAVKRGSAVAQIQVRRNPSSALKTNTSTASDRLDPNHAVQCQKPLP